MSFRKEFNFRQECSVTSRDTAATEAAFVIAFTDVGLDTQPPTKSGITLSRIYC